MIDFMEYKCKPVNLLDGVLMNSIYPDSFQIPEADAIARLKEGEFVKVGAANERFWVQIEYIAQGKFIVGRVDNDLVNTGIHGLDYNDHILFRSHNILSL